MPLGKHVPDPAGRVPVQASQSESREMKFAPEPIDCSDCSVGPHSVYGVALTANPQVMSACRLAVKRFEPRHVLVPAGKLLETAMTLREGWACRFKLLPDGRRHILSFLIPGDAVLLENLLAPRFVPPYAVKALTPVSVCLFELGDYCRISTSSPEQRARLDSYTQQWGTHVSRRQVDLGRRSATGRVAQLLLELESRLAERQLVDEDGFPFPLGQREISDATGVTTAHVNRVLSQLREAGVIETGRKRLGIRDRARLRELGEGD